MACASFLKFHPTLPKQGALVVTRHAYAEMPANKRRQELTKEEKARQRHSVEVSTAGNYLHIQPSVLETLTRSAANANANRHRSRKVPENVINEETTGEKSPAADKMNSDEKHEYHTVSVLPPALKYLVYLWEDLTSNCLQIISQYVNVESPAYMSGLRSEEKRKSEAKEKLSTLEKRSKKSHRKQTTPRRYLGKYSYIYC